MNVGRLRLAYCLLLVFTLLVMLYDELHLRGWLFQHYGRESVLAGSLPNFLAELLFSFAFAVIKLPRTPREILRAALLPATALSLYEVAQRWMPGRTFDPADLPATLVGAIVAGSCLRWPC